MFGPDDSGLKFAGQADMRFGASPRLRSSLTARQLDADRFLSQCGRAPRLRPPNCCQTCAA